MRPVPASLLAGAGLCGLALLPWFASGYVLSFMFLLFMYIALAQSWNIFSGYTGYISFGHAAFFGTGAYAAALLLVRGSLPVGIATLCGGVLAAGLASVVGLITLRVRGVFFAIALLGLSETLRILAGYWESLTGGALGVNLPPHWSAGLAYYAMGLTALVTVAVALRVATSDFGLDLLAIREDETAAMCLGIPTTRLKVGAFVASAFFAGVAGAIYAWQISYIEPASAFSPLITIQTAVIALFGGAGTVTGPLLGAVVFALLYEVLWANFPYVYRLIFGMLIMLIMIYFPHGLMGQLIRSGRLPLRRYY